MQRSVTVSASGTVTAPPDLARISSGVVMDAKTAQEAVAANSVAMTKVIDALKGLGIPAADIQTSDFNVEPLTHYSKDGSPPQITGYRVSNQVTVVLRDMTQLGATIDQLVREGANRINGLTFESSTADVLKDQARQSAMATALRRAKLLATAAGAEVGKVLQISEETAVSQGPMLRRMAASAAEAVPVESGSVDLQARVTVTWELK